VQQLAVLLEAGIAPPRAWQLLAEAGDPVAADVASAPPGTRISEVLDAHGETWRQIAIVVRRRDGRRAARLQSAPLRRR
jgi:tight adherence protein B